MNSELESFQLQLLSIRQSAPGLWNGLTDAQFNWRPSADRWSIGDCFAHLNETAGKFVPEIDRTLAKARAEGLTSAEGGGLGLVERLFLAMNEPPPKMRVKAPQAFRPPASSQRPLAAVSRDFLAWQDELAVRIGRAEGIDLGRARGRSPVVPLVRWSLRGMFAVLLAHERRHIWQAREVRTARAFPV